MKNNIAEYNGLKYPVWLDILSIFCVKFGKENKKRKKQKTKKTAMSRIETQLSHLSFVKYHIS